MITEEEKAKRRKAVDYAKATCALSGIYLEQYLLDIAEEYVRGELSREEFSEKFSEAVERGY